jgi:uroporphyrinogen decarboxylase
VNVGRTRFLRACACEPVDVTPVWLMRQAGRVLPEYRALKERYSFVELVRTPDLAAEVTLQPIRRFDFDAAIIFSDILVVPEALGQPYRFNNGGGVRMDFALRERRDIESLETGHVRERLEYVAEALRRVHRELAGRKALIGFSGSPWTLANFMLEGGSASAFTRARSLFENDRGTYDALAERLTRAVIEYLNLQCEAGAEALQIFDTLAGLLPGDGFEAASGRWIREIVSGVRHSVPVIVFCKGAPVPVAEIARTGAGVIGLDASARLDRVRREVSAEVALQGNLDPEVLTTNPAIVRRETRAILDSMRGQPGHVFNLGHGVPPTSPLENIEALVSAVRTSS